MGLLFCYHCESFFYVTLIGGWVYNSAPMVSRFAILLPSECIIFILLSSCFVVLFYSHWGLGLLFCSNCVSFYSLLPLGYGFVILPSLRVVLLCYSHWGLGILFCSHCEPFCYFTPIRVNNFYSALIVLCCVILLSLGFGFVTLL